MQSIHPAQPQLQPHSQRSQQPQEDHLTTKMIRFFKVFPMINDQRESKYPQDAYLLEWIKNPDPESEFDKKTKWFRNWLPDSLLLFLMQLMGYNGYLMYFNHELVGHVFYQERRGLWYIFSVCIKADYGSKGYSKYLMKMVLEHCFHASDVSGVRIGRGGHKKIDTIQQRVVKNQMGLSFKATSGSSVGWVMFIREPISGHTSSSIME